MFSSLFGKRRSSPVEDQTPPIPGPLDEDFVVVGSSSPGGGLYPNVSGGGPPNPQRAAPAIPRTKIAEQPFHYLQGVPFQLSRELKMANNTDAYATEIGDLLAFLTNKVNMCSYEYDFSEERSVLKEC